MKKLINEPSSYVGQSLEGLVAVHPDLVLDGHDQRVVRRRNGVRKGKVGIVSGGGSGHLPLFCGYVGQGLIDTCAVGNVFEGPGYNSCLEAARLADGGAGVLQLIGNYGGERMNFATVRDELQDEGVRVETVLGTDDIASAAPEERNKRRGVAGLLFAYKAAGARAEEGGALSEVRAAAARAVERTRTIGVALGPCQIPGADKPSFTLGEREIEMGMGIHGEPGIWRDELKTANEIVDEMIRRLLEERPEDGDDRVSILVNSLGGTPLEELFIMYGRAASLLKERGFRIIRPLVGHFVTSMEMTGASISLSFLDDELERLYAAPAECPFWSVKG